MKRSLFYAVVVLLCTFSTSSFAETPHNVVWSNTTAARLNPLGLVSATDVEYRFRLYESDSLALANNFIGAGVQPILSPAWFRGGPFISLQPASVANFKAGYEYVSYFGTFDQVLSFPDPSAEHSDDRLEELGEAGENEATSGGVFYVSALLQAKVGPVAIRNALRFNKFNVDLPDGDTVYYEQTWDILVPGNGWIFTNDADVLFLTDFGLVAGVRYNVTNAFYDLADGEENPNGPIHRIGPLISYGFYNNPGGAVDSFSVFTLINWHLTHRYRTGEEVSQAVPYFALGIKTTGDLF